MYGQDNEDDVILSYVGNTVGRFLDIGAYDGANISNTRALRERGWGGTLVEGGVAAFKGLVGTCGGDPDLKLVHAVISADEWGLVPWWERGMASTMFRGMAERASLGMGWNDADWDHFYTPMVPMHELLRIVPGPYHVVSLDTEGNSVPLLQQMDLTALHTRIICIEYENLRAEAIAHCRKHGLGQQLFDNGCNIILAE